jgi:Ca-activated chloride channel family protein
MISNIKTPSEKEFLRIGVDLKKEESGKFHLQVGLRSKDQSLKSMSPLNLTLLLDNSGSMNGNSLSLAKETIIEICKHLTDRDRISLITVNRQSNIILNNQKAKLKAVQDALSGIEANDITDLTEGIKKAYEIAGQNYDANSLNRVIVLSDGATNAGKESLELISKYSQDSDRQGIYLVGIGFGQGFNDNLMNHFTDKGRGGYLFIDSSSEIKRFSNPVYFVSVFDIALKDVRLKNGTSCRLESRKISW